MKKTSRRVVSIVLALLMVLTIMPMVNIKAKAATGVEDFVARCYSVALGRAGDAEGINYWVGEINGKKRTGVDVVYNFIFSEEYTNQKTSNEKFVNDLYTMFMGRPADQSGYDYWCGQLKEGKTRKDIFTGFANSQEFYETCANYGITAGFYTDTVPLSQLSNINLFVARMYETTLGRLGDPGGQKYWTEGLASGELTGIGCAANFIKSEEYTKKGLSDEEYVENLYAAFMGRPSDEGGKTNWVNALKSGDMTRDMVFEGFANSAEFQGICNSYQIVPGSYQSPDSKARIIKQAVIKNAATGEIRAIRDYDARGNCVKSTLIFKIFDIEKQQLVDTKYVYEYVYDANDNCVKYIGRDTNGAISWYNDMFYDANGNLIKDIFYEDGKEWSSMSTYTYDAKGRMQFANVKFKDGSVQTVEYQFSEDGTIEKNISKDGNGKVLNSGIAVLNEKGEQIKYTMYDDKGAVVYSRDYEYTSNGEIAWFIEYNSKGEQTYKEINTYDRWGNLVKSVSTNYIDGQVIEIVEIYENTYY